LKIFIQHPKVALIQKAILVLSGSTAIVLSLADLFGLLTLSWIRSEIAIITLLLLGLFLLGITFLIEESTTRIEKEIKSLPGVEVIQFETVSDVYNYVAAQLRSATKSVDDITWGSRKGYRTKIEEQAYEHYLKAIELVCKKGNIKYREVSSLSDEHYFNRSMHLIKKKYYNYHLGYHDLSKTKVPLMSYIIIDSEQVILGFYRVPTLSPEGEIQLTITQPTIVKLYEDYFETLWSSSDKIKDTTKINHDLIGKIRKKLNIKEND
jgi:hypothetical protein